MTSTPPFPSVSPCHLSRPDGRRGCQETSQGGSQGGRASAESISNNIKNTWHLSVTHYSGYSDCIATTTTLLLLLLLPLLLLLLLLLPLLPLPPPLLLVLLLLGYNIDRRRPTCSRDHPKASDSEDVAELEGDNAETPVLAQLVSPRLACLGMQPAPPPPPASTTEMSR